MTDALAELLSEQTAHGAFPSWVESGDVVHRDATCFVTAQVALILQDLLATSPSQARALREARDRALTFVEACAAPELSGAFRFYPYDLDSPRLAIRLPPDGDDTALAWLALLRAGWRSKAEARAVLPSLFDRLRAAGSQRGDPPWLRRGAYRTWFDDLGGPPDVCVNANILAALAEAGCPAVPEPAAAITAACATLEPSNLTLRALAPFYADAAEVAIALERAVSAGARDLAPAAMRTADLNWRDRLAGRPANRPLYCNAHGRPLWRSPSLQQARRRLDQLAAVISSEDLFSSTVGGGDVVHV